MSSATRTGYRPSGGTGGGGGGDGFVAWGPDFGGDAGDRHTAGVAAGLPTMALIGARTVEGAPTMPALELSGRTADLGASVALAMLDLAGTTPDCGAAAALAALDLAGAMPDVRGATTMPALTLAGGHALGAVAPVMPVLDLSGRTADCAGDVTKIEYTTGQFLASKDTWWPEIALCPDDANKNGTDLTLDGTAATKKDGLIGFDLAGFPANATVSTATLTVNVKAAAAVAMNIQLHKIANANEGWNEGTVSCSDNPASDGNVQTVQIPANGTGERAFTLNAAWRTRIEARMGVGVCSFYLIPEGLTTQFTLEATDEGVNDASGARLALTFTVPT